MERAAGRPRPDSCELCGRPPGKNALHFDHDHKTGAFRGWLCRGCNSALGSVEDNPVLLESLANYLRNGGIQS